MRPTDAEILEQESRLSGDIVAEFPLIGHVYDLSRLIGEFAEGGGFRNKLDKVMLQFGKYRKVRPDGNCFYRAYLFGLLEMTVKAGPEAVGILGTKFKDLAEECKKSGYDSFAVDEFYELFDEQLQLLVQNPLDITILESRVFSDSSVDGYLIALMRCICGTALKRWPDDFIPFLPSEYLSIDAFCRNEVDPMYRDCDQIHIVALTRLLAIPIDIVYFDQSDSELSIHSFGAPSDLFKTPITLLYKPGHYDLLYPLE